MRRRLIALAFIASLFPVAGGATPVLAACGESTKFVQQVAGTSHYYGIRDAVFSWDHRPMCSVNAHSTFMRMSDDYRSWLEIGIREETDGTVHYWSEWRSYPNPTQLAYYDSTFGLAALNQWYSFMIQNQGSGIFTLWWEDGSNPAFNNWNFMGVSDAMPRNTGNLESEEARFGTANAMHTATNLGKQGTHNGTWSGWTNLQCDASQNSITDWKAVKGSNITWTVEHVSSGLC